MTIKKIKKNQTVEVVESLLKKKEAKLAITEAKIDGMILEISEDKPGKFRVSRDYTKESKLKLNRLRRD